MDRTFTRTLTLGRANAEARTVAASISSEFPVNRGGFEEVLSHRPGAVDLSRMPLPVVEAHRASEPPVAVFEGGRVEGGKLRGLIRFGSSARAVELFADVAAGVIRNLSVGYLILKERWEANGARLVALAWQPYEVSLVGAPADPSIGFGRSLHSLKGQQMDNMQSNAAGAAGEFNDDAPRLSRSQRRAAQAAAIAAETELTRGVALERERTQSIRALGAKFARWGGEELASAAIDSGLPWDDFRERLMDQVERRQTPSSAISQMPADLSSIGAPAAFGAGARHRPFTGKLRAFTGPSAERDAFASGMWLRAQITRDSRAARWCEDHGVGTRAMGTGLFASGGALVPDELANAVLTNVEQYGIFRQYARIMPMNSATLAVPKAVGGLTAAYIPENTEQAAVDQTWANVLLSAKKIGVLCRLSTELMEDSVINLADYLAGEAARAFGEAEDRAGFIGDGTSAYGGMEGLLTKLERAAHAGGRYTTASGHDTFSEIDNADLTGVMSKLPARALRRARWYCSPVAHGLVFERLAAAAGGNTPDSLAGQPVKSWRGHEIITVPGAVLPAGESTDYTGKVMLLFGDLELSSLLGIRREIQVRVLDETYAAFDQVGVQVLQRFDIVNHDVGDATTPGAVVALYGNS